jgi:hypothetical protein
MVVATNIRRLCRVRAIAVSLLLLSASSAQSHDFMVSAGKGAQAGADQSNKLTSIDFSFFTLERSDRQHFQVGVSYTRLRTDAAINGDLYAISVYPQLTLYPSSTSRIAAHTPRWGKLYVLLRALGPSYISENSLGMRMQDNHFSFQAQIGAGLLFDINDEVEGNVSVSWRHFSNANLFNDNDGIDVPFVIAVGVRF